MTADCCWLKQNFIKAHTLTVFPGATYTHSCFQAPKIQQIAAQVIVPALVVRLCHAECWEFCQWDIRWLLLNIHVLTLYIFFFFKIYIFWTETWWWKVDGRDASSPLSRVQPNVFKSFHLALLSVYHQILVSLKALRAERSQQPTDTSSTVSEGCPAEAVRQKTTGISYDRSVWLIIKLHQVPFVQLFHRSTNPSLDGMRPTVNFANVDLTTMHKS